MEKGKIKSNKDDSSEIAPRCLLNISLATATWLKWQLRAHVLENAEPIMVQYDTAN